MSSALWVISHFVRFQILRAEVAWNASRSDTHARKLAQLEARKNALQVRFAALEREIEERDGKAEI